MSAAPPAIFPMERRTGLRKRVQASVEQEGGRATVSCDAGEKLHVGMAEWLLGLCRVFDFSCVWTAEYSGFSRE